MHQLSKKIFRNKFGWNDFETSTSTLENEPFESREARTFFLPSPTKNPPTRNAGSRPGKFKIVVSEISCFSGDEKGIYFNCDLLCEVKLRGSGCTYASVLMLSDVPESNARHFVGRLFPSRKRVAANEFEPTRPPTPLIIIHLNKPRIFTPRREDFFPRWREDLRN